MLESLCVGELEDLIDLRIISTVKVNTIIGLRIYRRRIITNRRREYIVQYLLELGTATVRAGSSNLLIKVAGIFASSVILRTPKKLVIL